MKHISLAFAGVVAGSMALSAQAGTTEWWAESFSSTDYPSITDMTNDFTKGTWTMREGDVSSLYAGAYSNEVATAIAPTVPSDVLVLNTEGQELTFAPTNATPASDVTVVDADVYFVGSDTEPNLSEDTTVQFALFLKVPEDTGANGVSNSVMVYVRDEGVTGWIALEDTDIADKSWHHVRVEIQYDTTEGSSAHVYIDGTRKTPVDGYTLANGATTYTGLNNVSFKGTGAVDNFTGGFKVAEAAPLHTFTATAYVNGSVTNDLIAAVEDTAAGTDAQFLVPRTVDGKTITNIVVKALATGSDVAYAVTDDGTNFSVEPSGLSYMASAGSILITISTDDAADTGSAQTYPALEVYYASAVVPPTTYSASITLPAGYTLAGVKVNNVAQDPLPSLPMTVNDGDVVEFTYTNADGVSKTKTVTVSGADVTATTEAFTWADYLGAAVSGAYEIDSLAELKLFQKGVAAGLATSNETFKLTTDVTLDTAWEGIGLKGGKDYVNGSKKNIPAYEAGAFCGTFDGQNHTISNFQMENGTDYGAFFNSVNGATISNLKISFKENKLCANTADGGSDTGAAFVGVARNSTLSNLTALATQDVTTVSASKDMAGIVGYLMAGSTVDSCTNELNVASLKSDGARKSGGIALITQEGSGTATIRNCKNSGMVTLGYAGGYKGGIVGYIGVSTTIVDCENTAAVQLFHFQTGSVTASGTNKGNAGVASNDKSGGVDGLNFATVTENVATFVADDALAAGNAYKVMGPSATATYEFTAAGSISFDTNLVQAVTFNITVAQGLKDPPTETTADGVVTFTARALATPTVTVTGGANATAAWTVNGTPAAEAPATLTEGDTYAVVYTANAGYEFAAGATTSTNGTAGTENIVITISDAVASSQEPEEIAPETLGDEVYTTEADAQAAAENVSVGASTAVATALDATELEAYKAMFEIKPVQDNGEWKLTADLTSAAEATLTTQATDDAGDLVTAGFTGTVTVDATPGFYYSIVWGTGVTNLGNETARVLAEDDEVTLTFPPNAANSGFYKVKISVVPSASN